ncbi:uncharacterized protein [Bemisia tabaci]|uniref:uncharacterized protein isoform X1 n=2 Tax=Bemisia tabaci TaxID=7038 RepID=UPI003B2894B7
MFKYTVMFHCSQIFVLWLHFTSFFNPVQAVAVTMGRKKIDICPIVDQRLQQVCFIKRKFGVMKKIHELSVLCDCDIALVIFTKSNKLYEFASSDMNEILLKYAENDDKPYESYTNKTIIENLNSRYGSAQNSCSNKCGLTESISGDSSSYNGGCLMAYGGSSSTIQQNHDISSSSLISSRACNESRVIVS